MTIDLGKNGDNCGIADHYASLLNIPFNFINAMKFYVLLFILAFSLAACAQSKDKRAALEVKGRVNEISVAPDEKIWLVTAMGNTYFTGRIDSNWHIGKPLTDKKDEFDPSNPSLDRISYFNKDTAIMTGYISFNEKEKNGYYLTNDAGNTWKLLSFGGDGWIYSVQTDKYGNAWMGSANKQVYYSNDFGKSWTTLKMPYALSDRTYSLYMSDSKNGIAGSNSNELLLTHDNWTTSVKLETPLDQKKIKMDESSDYMDNGISKVLKWKNNFVVVQSGHLFYTDSKTINWRPFAINIIDIELDEVSKKLFAITQDLDVVYFTSPNSFTKLTNQRLPSFSIDIKFVNHSLFVLCSDNEVYKIDQNGLKRSQLCTTDKKIADPIILRQGKEITWGADGKHIYLSENKKRDWYRENIAEFDIVDLKLLNDSMAVLWDGINNHLYSLSAHKFKNYNIKNPIDDFITSGLKSFTISAGTSGCFHYQRNEIIYTSKDGKTLETNNVSEEKSSMVGQKTIPRVFRNEVENGTFTQVLKTINSAPETIPKLADFQITGTDIKNYLNLVDEQLKSKKSNYPNRKKPIDKIFYNAVPKMLDTLKDSVIREFLSQRERIWSTTSYWFDVKLVDQNNDTITVSRKYFESPLPWNLPWSFEYKGQNFTCYNLEFSKFIYTCIPQNFMNKGLFDNKILLMQLADYLYYRKEGLL